MMTKRCRRCGRELTNPISRERNYGPRCWQIVCNENLKMKPLVEVFG